MACEKETFTFINDRTVFQYRYPNEVSLNSKQRERESEINHCFVCELFWASVVSFFCSRFTEGKESVRIVWGLNSTLFFISEDCRRSAVRMKKNTHRVQIQCYFTACMFRNHFILLVFFRIHWYIASSNAYKCLFGHFKINLMPPSWIKI